MSYPKHSLTRLTKPFGDYDSRVWQYYAAFGIAVIGLMAVMLTFVVGDVVAKWVSDLTDAGRTNVQTVQGRIDAYEPWVFAVGVASIGMIKIGIAVVLWGIVKRIWIRVDSLKEALPALKKA